MEDHKHKDTESAQLRNLPGELAGRTVVTAEEKEKADAYRDEVMAQLSAAHRRTDDDLRMTSAINGERFHRAEVERLEALGEPSFINRLAWAENLRIQGKLGEALTVVPLSEDPRAQEVYGRIMTQLDAILTPDEECCDCEPNEDFPVQFIKERIYSWVHGGWTNMIVCNCCGHANVTSQTPALLAELERERNRPYKPGELHDQQVAAKLKTKVKARVGKEV